MVVENVTMAARLKGISGDPFNGICTSNVTIQLAKTKNVPWTCTDIAGISTDGTLAPCDLLPDQGEEKIGACTFPEDSLPIEDVKVQTCSYNRKKRLSSREQSKANNVILQKLYLKHCVLIKTLNKGATTSQIQK
ncbi:polygalacturonase protein [Spatholobus suberectus]|nr:polygalacturonase protein [Spatholobus suberectus]